MYPDSQLEKLAQDGHVGSQLGREAPFRWIVKGSCRNNGNNIRFITLLVLLIKDTCRIIFTEQHAVRTCLHYRSICMLYTICIYIGVVHQGIISGISGNICTLALYLEIFTPQFCIWKYLHPSSISGNMCTVALYLEIFVPQLYIWKYLHLIALDLYAHFAHDDYIRSSNTRNSVILHTVHTLRQFYYHISRLDIYHITLSGCAIYIQTIVTVFAVPFCSYSS